METALAQLLGPATAPSPKPTPSFKLLLAAFALLVLAVGSLTVSQLRGPSPTSEPSASGRADTSLPTQSSTTPSAASPTSEYRIDAAFYRDRTGAVERLTPGAKLLPDETLSLQVELSAPAYVYVVNEDERGESYLLFPIPGLALRNPLPPGQRHRLPGMWDGELVSWQVTSVGGTEHFLIVASPQPSREFEEMFASLPLPSFGKPAVKLSNEGVGLLRSVGGLAASPTRGDRQLRMLPEFSTPLAPSEERVRGVWIRQAMFENPAKR